MELSELIAPYVTGDDPGHAVGVYRGGELVAHAAALCELTAVPVAGMDEERLMHLLAGQTGLNFPPGTAWSYSNSGFVLAAAVLRRLTGRSLAEFAAERLFHPLGMHATRFRDDLTVPVRGIATGYTPAAGGGWARVDITEEVVGDGGVLTYLNDLVAWQHFMLTGAVLGADVRDALLAPAVLADGRRLPYALGLEITTLGGRDVYLHLGHIDGFRSALAYLIDGGVGVAVLANRNDTFPAEIAVRIAERLTGVAAPPPPARLARSAALAAQPVVTGLWYSPELDVHLAIGAADDGTITRAEGDSGDRYAAMSDGSWLGIGSAASTRLRRVGDELWRDEIVGDEPADVYVCAAEPPPAAPPAGTYYSEELRAYATFATVGSGPPGAAAVTIGLAGPRAVSPVSDGVWAGEGLTIRLLPGEAELEISLYGASRCRFSRVDRSPLPRQRGL